MLTEKDYCDFKTIRDLEVLGMNVYTSFCGVEVLKHLLLYEAQKFLREEKSIYVTVGCPLIMNEGLGWSYEVCDKPWNGHSDDDCVKASGGAYDSYEEALSEGLRTAIKILKEK